MTLETLCHQYADFRRTLGERFAVNDAILNAFCRAIGPHVDIADVSSKKVDAFLIGKGEITTSWNVRHNALLGLYRYAISRGFVKTSPLPLTKPKVLTTFQPYIYSPTELCRILDSAESCPRPRSDLDASVMRVLILLMYGAALRISEVVSLTVGDVDLAGAVLTIRNSKFFKSRLVPLGPKTVRVLAEYAARQQSPTRNFEDHFFVGRNSKRISIRKLQRAFQQIRGHAALHREGGPRCQPRLHDLRHTSAVHRLTSWYREGKNLQKLLPQLSVYMGHAHLAATQVYLTMTPELLGEASLRFEHYAMREGNND